MSTLAQSDPCTDIVLDFIAGGVPDNPGGESGGNYNAVIGDMHATDDLGAKTLAEIYGLQAKLLGMGRPSSAIGRYQIIRRTLQALAAQLNVSSDTLFLDALQDQLAVKLLVQRGYQAWWRGQMNDEELLHNLSCEWASLPDPERGGKSHYDGVGPNHASTTLAKCYAMLTRARAAKPS